MSGHRSPESLSINIATSRSVSLQLRSSVECGEGEGANTLELFSVAITELLRNVFPKNWTTIMPADDQQQPSDQPFPKDALAIYEGYEDHEYLA